MMLEKKKQDWMQKLAIRILHLNYLQQPSLCRFFATRCYYRFSGSGLFIHLILLILLSSPSNHILEACRSQAHVDHISKLCGLGSMSAKTAMIFSTQICFRLFPFGGSKTRDIPLQTQKEQGYFAAPCQIEHHWTNPELANTYSYIGTPLLFLTLLIALSISAVGFLREFETPCPHLKLVKNVRDWPDPSALSDSSTTATQWLSCCSSRCSITVFWKRRVRCTSISPTAQHFTSHHGQRHQAVCLIFCQDLYQILMHLLALWSLPQSNKMDIATQSCARGKGRDGQRWFYGNLIEWM